MSVRLTKNITWLWIASLFIATVGVSGQQIYCYCIGETTFSLFEAEDACADNPQKDCCSKTASKPAHSCCEKKDPSVPTQDCTKKTTKVFQLKTEFTVQEKWTENLPSLSVDQDFESVPFPAFQNISRSQKLAFQPFAKPPPPLSGRMICVRHGVFRC